MSLLDTCLQITGSFENGAPKYDGLTGNEDLQGLSVGILSFAAGQGQLQALVKAIAEKTGWDKAQSFFKSDIRFFSTLTPEAAVAFCKAHYLVDGSNKIAPAAAEAWQSFLNQPESIEVQNEIATSKFLEPALAIAKKYCPDDFQRTRVGAFFFDLVVQEGSMSKVEPTTTPDATEALNFAGLNSKSNAELWESVVKDDALANLLIYYSMERSKFANPKYQWDVMARRSTIAARGGWVHGQRFDFHQLLD